MSPNRARPAIDFAGPATYRIVVQGALSEPWHDRLAGMTITTTRSPGAAPYTTLVGRISDQAELNGLLDTLYGLHLSILAVVTIDEVD